MGPIRHVRKVVMISVLLLALTLSLGGGVASKSNDSAATYEQLKLFTDVLSIIQNQYVDETQPKEVIYGAVRGMLRSLDPHSSFMDPESYREMQVETSGSFGGLGIEITIRDDVLTVVAPIDGTPAWRAGIQPGDRIVKIEGLATKDMSLPDAVKKMRGAEGHEGHDHASCARAPRSRSTSRSRARSSRSRASRRRSSSPGSATSASASSRSGRRRTWSRRSRSSTRAGSSRA